MVSTSIVIGMCVLNDEVFFGQLFQPEIPLKIYRATYEIIIWYKFLWIVFGQIESECEQQSTHE